MNIHINIFTHIRVQTHTQHIMNHLRGYGAARLYLHDDVVECESDAQPVRLALEVDAKLERLLDGATLARLGRGGAAQHAEEA